MPPAASLSAPLAAAPGLALDRRTLLALATVYVLWGSTYYAMSVAIAGGLPPLAMSGLRFSVAGAVLLALSRATGAPWPSARQWLLSVPIGVLFFVAGNGFISIAMQSIDSGAAAVLCATMPLWTALLAGATGERTGGREWLGLALGFAGVVVLVGGTSAAGQPVHLVLLLLSPPAWAVGSLMARRLPLPPGLGSAALQMITGGVALGLVAAARGESFSSGASTDAWLALAYLAVAGSLVGFSAFNWLLRNTRPALATSYAYVNPVLAVLIGAALGNEPLGPSTIAATGLIVGAVVLVARGRSGGRSRG